MEERANKLNPELLHIYPQANSNKNAWIIGTPEMLRQLGEALLAAAAGAVTSVEAADGDGEGYSCIAIPVTDLAIAERLVLPYSEHPHPHIGWVPPKDALYPFEFGLLTETDLVAALREQLRNNR